MLWLSEAPIKLEKDHVPFSQGTVWDSVFLCWAGRGSLCAVARGFCVGLGCRI